MNLGIFNSPMPENEKFKHYKRLKADGEALQRELDRQLSIQVEVPLYIGAERIKTNDIKPIIVPHNHGKVLGTYSNANAEHIQMSVQAAMKARQAWAETSWSDRAAIFLRAAELLAGPYREVLNASTMLNQSKTYYQAEIDSACELIDFWRFNVRYLENIYREQPMKNAADCWNRLEYRPLEGFVFAVTPFNFTAIGGNLPTAPALMGNTVVWKPASTAVLSAYYIMEILKEAGLPDGVINMVPGKGSEMGSYILDHADFAGLHFTGSTQTFNYMWKRIGENIANGVYKSYPRIVGETGGKDFVLAYKDADEDALASALVRGAFEYQGQKCSAASRAYIPKSIWPSVAQKMFKLLEIARYGDVYDFNNFGGAVIDKSSFNNIVSYIEHAKSSKDAHVVYGGTYDDSKGYFINPTIIEATDPKYKSMSEEIFGPVLTVYSYEDDKLDGVMDLVDETSGYALTGAVFAKDRYIINKMTRRLVNAAGNFYINDKPTGAVVGQQPFGGARASGTNDKAGSPLNLLRWISPRTIKETFSSYKGL